MTNGEKYKDEDGSITIKFKTGTKLYEYFKDMELNKTYTLKELGL